MKDFIDREGQVEEWQERQMAAEFAIMQLANVLKTLCMGTGAGNAWEQLTADLRQASALRPENVVSMLPPEADHHTRRISALVLGLLEGRDPRSVLADLGGGSQPA